MIFKDLDSLVIPEGEVSEIRSAVDGTLLWKKVIPIENVPSQSGTLTYTGSTLTPSWSNYDSAQLDIGGDTSAANAGTYTATFTPKDGYCWSDRTTTAKSVTWTIGRATISTVPSQSGTLTYTGSSQTPKWSNYNTTQLSIGGTTKATNAGSYTATFTPTSNYQWSGGTVTAKSVTWKIGKADANLTTSVTKLEFDRTTVNKAKTFTATRNGNGTISVTESGGILNATVKSGATSSKATISVNHSYTSTIDQKTTITVKCAESTNYNADSATVIGYYYNEE